MKEIKDLLKDHPFFKDLKPDQIELIADCGKNVHFKEREIAFTEGEPANWFYVIRKGKVALEISGVERGPIRIQTLEEGEIFGWSWLIPPYRWAFTAMAIEETSTIALDGKCLRGKCEKNHDLGYELLKRFSIVLAKRLEWTRMQLLDVYGEHSPTA